MARKDLKDLILETGRHKEYKPGRRNKRIRDDDLDATIAPMRNVRTYSLRDRTEPLRRFLNKQVGRPWDKVYSEICQVADSRSLRGHHLRSHIDDTVVMYHDVIKTDNGYRRRPRWYDQSMYGLSVCFMEHQLFVDENGILRKPKSHERTPSKNQKLIRKQEYNNNFRPIDQTSGYLYMNNGWWHVSWLIPKIEYNEKSNKYKLSAKFRNHIMESCCGKVLVRDIHQTEFKLVDFFELTHDKTRSLSYYNSNNPWIIFPLSKRQLNKREAQNLGLVA